MFIHLDFSLKWDICWGSLSWQYFGWSFLGCQQCQQVCSGVKEYGAKVAQHSSHQVHSQLVDVFFPWNPTSEVQNRKFVTVGQVRKSLLLANLKQISFSLWRWSGSYSLLILQDLWPSPSFAELCEGWHLLSTKGIQSRKPRFLLCQWLARKRCWSTLIVIDWLI